MNIKDLIRLGVPPGEASRRGIDFIARYLLKGLDRAQLPAEIESIVRLPGEFVDDELRVEFGTFTIAEPVGDLPPGEYVALLSHSGSRGTGAAVCNHV